LSAWAQSVVAALVVALLFRLVVTRAAFVAVLLVLVKETHGTAARIRISRVFVEVAATIAGGAAFVRLTVREGQFDLEHAGVTTFAVAGSDWISVALLAALVYVLLAAFVTLGTRDELPALRRGAPRTALRSSLTTPRALFLGQRPPAIFIETESRAFFAWLLPGLIDSALWEAHSIGDMSSHRRDNYAWVGAAGEGVEDGKAVFDDDDPELSLFRGAAGAAPHSRHGQSFAWGMAACTVVIALIGAGVLLHPPSAAATMTYPLHETVSSYSVRYGRDLARPDLRSPRELTLLRGAIGDHKAGGFVLFRSSDWMASVLKKPRRLNAVSLRARIDSISAGGGIGVVCGAAGGWSFDALLLSTNGRWRISRIHRNRSAPISLGSAPTRLIQPPFVVEGVCSRAHLLLRVNGHVVAEGVDRALTRGRIGLATRGSVRVRGERLTNIRSIERAS
jgi:hypothetical protein